MLSTGLPWAWLSQQGLQGHGGTRVPRQKLAGLPSPQWSLHPPGLSLSNKREGAGERAATEGLSREARGTGACREQVSLPRGHHSECPTSGSARLVIFGNSSAQSQQGEAAASNMEGLLTLKCASTLQGQKESPRGHHTEGLCPPSSPDCPCKVQAVRSPAHSARALLLSLRSSLPTAKLSHTQTDK